MLKGSYWCVFFATIRLLLNSPFTAQAQTVIGMGTDDPNPNAVLELVPENGNQGFLAPRLTSAQRNASSFTNRLTDADNGLLVFDTEEGQFFYWFQGKWHRGIANSQDGTNTVAHGTTWFTGTTAPSSISASDGDFYIDESTGEIYKFSNNAFSIIGSLGTSSEISNRTQDLSSVLQQNNSAANEKITDLGEPTEANDAATKDYVDQSVGALSISDSDNQSLSDVLGEGNDASENKIVNLADPTNAQDAATKKYVDTQVLSIPTSPTPILPDGTIYLGNAANQPQAVTIQGDVTIAADGTVTIQNASISSAKIINNAVTRDKINANVAGLGLSQAGNGSLQVDVGGDVATSGSDLSVIRLQGNDIAPLAPSDSQVLQWDGSNSQWTPTTLTTLGSDRSGAWYSGANDPNSTATPDVVNGDYYFETNTQTVYLRVDGTWDPVGSLAGPTVTTPETLSGGPEPDGNDGKVGDFYIRNNGNVYVKVKIGGNVDNRWIKINE